MPVRVARRSRIPFALAAALSALLFVAASVLWVASYRARTAVPFRRGVTLWEVASDGGRQGLDNGPPRAREQAAIDDARRRSADLLARAVKARRRYDLAEPGSPGM